MHSVDPSKAQYTPQISLDLFFNLKFFSFNLVNRSNLATYTKNFKQVSPLNKKHESDRNKKSDLGKNSVLKVISKESTVCLLENSCEWWQIYRCLVSCIENVGRLLIGRKNLDLLAQIRAHLATSYA